MDNSGIDSNTAATLALLADTRRAGGYGYGGGEGGWGCAGPWATPTANGVRIEEGNKAAASAFENLLDQNQFAATNGNITECCNRVTDNQVNGEFRTGDRIRDVERLVIDGQKEAAACCCENQKELIRLKGDLSLENCQNTARLEAKIIEENSKTRELINGNALAAANARVTQLETINAITQACGCCGGTTAGN